ncbi:MAG: IMS domain-containing protein, partial [Terriglobales bacterium]
AIASAAATASTAPLKDQFNDLINNWQRVKKAALFDLTARDLNSVLSGKALTTQLGAIKWLQDHHKHYEMDAKSVAVDHYVELVRGQKYAVYAKVIESSKYIDDTNKEVLKEVDDDSYTVNYTVEKSQDHWLITDFSKLTNSGNNDQTVKGPSKASR